MTGNVLQFPLSEATAVPSIAATAEETTSSVIQFRPAPRSRGDAIAALPKEEKRLIAAEIERRISARMPGSLKKQRDARYKAWGKAGARASFWKALDDLQHALYVAQREKMPEASQYDPVELGSASWHATRHAYQDAIDRQLLTRAPNMGCVRWKRLQKFSRLPRDRIERAIADDLAWLKRYPASERRVRRKPE